VAGKGKDSEARYAPARCLLRAGQEAEARELCRDAYQRALEHGLPPIDADFRTALHQPGREDDPWTALMRKTAEKLVAGRQRPAAVVLAYQCRQLGDLPLSDNVLRLALADVKEEDRPSTYLAAIDYFRSFNLDAQADDLVRELLEKKELAGAPGLWRLAMQLADRRGQAGRAVACLERALELEYGPGGKNLPEVINLESWRKDYRRLLDHYQSLATALTDLGDQPRDELIRKTIRAADRWRAHDPEGAAPCQLAGSILKQLGASDLAWDYLTTPLGLRPGEGASLEGMAADLTRTGDYELADHALATASEANPDNGLLLWERARNLRQWGKGKEADHLLQRLAEEDQPAWQEVKPEARWQLKGR
jgi:hypothetical protein